jgi:hypothetical protein
MLLQLSDFGLLTGGSSVSRPPYSQGNFSWKLLMQQNTKSKRLFGNLHS